MKSKFFLSILGLVLFTVIGAPMLTAATGLPLAATSLGIVATSIGASAVPGASGMAFMAAPDVTTITTAFVQYGGEMLRKGVNSMEIVSDPFFRFFRNLEKPVVLPRISSTGNPRPYRTQDDTSGNGPLIGDRTLTAYMGKWDFDIDFENFRNTYLASGDTNPFYQVMLQKTAEDLWGSINDNVVYLGDYNAAGSTAAAIATGWGTHIADEITATNITPVTTGAVSAGAVSAVETLLSALPTWMRNKDGTSILCSYESFDLYRQDYRENYGFTFNARTGTNEFYVDNTNIRLRPCSWMGTSGRLIATVPGNLAWGTDGKGLSTAATPHRNIIEVRAMVPVGFQIADLDAIYVNDIA